MGKAFGEAGRDWSRRRSPRTRPGKATAHDPHAITAAAYHAICATLPLRSVGFEAEANERGERYVWLEDANGRIGSARCADPARAYVGGVGSSHAQSGSRPMAESADTSNAIIRPPIAWAVAIIVGLGAGWLYPLPFVPASVPRFWIGGGVFGSALALAIWAIVTIRRAGTRVETNKPTTVIVTKMDLTGLLAIRSTLACSRGQAGLAIAFNNLWMLATLLPLYLVIRFGIVAREEAYLEGKFGSGYLSYAHSPLAMRRQ